MEDLVYQLSLCSNIEELIIEKHRLCALSTSNGSCKDYFCSECPLEREYEKLKEVMQ